MKPHHDSQNALKRQSEFKKVNTALSEIRSEKVLDHVMNLDEPPHQQTLDDLQATMRALIKQGEDLEHQRKASEMIWRSSYGHRIGSVATRQADDKKSVGRYEFPVAPMHDLQWIDETVELRVVGLDPHFVFDLPRRIGPGYFELHCSFDAAKGVGAARVYFDYGNGFSELNSELVAAMPAIGEHQVFGVRLLAEAVRIRVDPEIALEEVFRLRAISIESVSRRRWYARHFWNAAAPYLRKPWRIPAALYYASTVLRTGGIRALGARIRNRGVHQPLEITSNNSINVADYAYWIELHEDNSSAELERQRSAASNFVNKPLISVLMPVYETPEPLLRAAIDSILAQTYDRLELCIADDASPSAHVAEVLKEYAARDRRVKVALRQENGHIAAASNSAFALATGEFVAMMDHDDVLPPHALYFVAEAINARPDGDLFYSDEDKINEVGERFSPFFKPDFSLELLRSQNYFNHLTVHRAEKVREAGAWRPGFDGSQDYDLNLRIVEQLDPKNIVHIPKVLYHWRAVTGSTALAGDEKGYAFNAGSRALQEHADRVGLKASIEPTPGAPYYRMRVAVPEPAPLVSIIIPTRDGLKILKDCIDSIRNLTTYQSYEIIILDNGSEQADTLAYFDELTSTGAAKVLHHNVPFNYSGINNYAVSHASGSIIVLLNNDILVISPDWLTELVSFAAQPEIGCVGAKLYYEDGTIQHAGVILGLGGVAGHSHKYFAHSDPGYFGRLKVVQNLSAVTAACLAIRKDVYLEMGGLNEEHLAVAFNDVDFCIRVRDAGYRNVWTPYAELYHLESVSRGFEDNPEKVARFNSEVDYMKNTWGDSLRVDPFYSPNLTMERENFGLRLTRYGA